MLQNKTYQAKPGEVPREWYEVDATDQVVGRLATVLAHVITGKHKPEYTPHVDTGDFVVVRNVHQVALTHQKWDRKNYYDHSGYAGGLKTRKAREVRQHKPEEILRRAVWGMTNKSKLAKRQMKKLKLYASDEHPHEAQKPKTLPENVTRKTILSEKKKTQGAK